MITTGKLLAEHDRDGPAYSGPMRAARLHSIGGTLQLDELPDPQPGPGEQLVDIAFASVNPLDVWISQGSVGAAAANLPWTPGTEATGHVDGRPVLVRGGGLGVMRQGLYCSRIAVPDAWLIPVAGDIDLAQAAALPVAGITAWQALHARAQIGPLDRVLVLGASGGVGSLAVQLAKVGCAEVWGQTSSPAKVDGITANGADKVVVTGAEGLEAAVESFQPTVILDSLGGPFTDAAIAVIENKGRLVVYGTSSNEQVSINLRRLYRKSVTLLGYGGMVDTAEEQRHALETLLAMMSAGTLHVPIGEVLPLAGAAEAHARILDRGVEGKIVLDCQN
jgi:NADPH2:quinone reductase